MTPREELIQVIETSSDDLIRAMLNLLKAMKLAPKAAAHENGQPSDSVYPLRGLPLIISDDFDEPMSELWEALES